MHRPLRIVLALAIGAAGASAYPGLFGSRGLFRVQDARTEGDFQVSLTAHGLGRTASISSIPDWQVRGLDPTLSAYTNDLVGAVAISPLEYFEVFFWHGGLREYTSPPDSSLVEMAWLRGYDNSWDYHNMVTGVKLSLPLLPVFKAGASVGYGLREYDTTAWYWGAFGIPRTEGLTWSALGTFSFRDVQAWTPTVHLNYGMAGHDWSTIAAALEYEIGKLDLFAEVVSEGDPGEGLLSVKRPIYLTPGIRVGYLRPVTLQGGASIGLNDIARDFELVAGLSLGTTFWRPGEARHGTIAGTVVDAKTGEPLSARIEFPQDDIESTPTDPKTGTFKVRDLEPGTVVIEATADGYYRAVVPIPVLAGRVAQQQFALEPAVTTGAINGIVMDARTEEGLAGARVRFPAGEFESLTADENGMFELEEVETGEYVLQASQEGYLTATTAVEVEAGDTVEVEFALVRKGMEITLKVFFDVGRATLKLESKDAFEQAARIMRENPDITVEIQGHTDNVGPARYNRDLSQERAQAVVDYLVTEYGIDRSRLTARGYGEDKPAASNDTPEGRARNRRVEFVVNK